MAEGKGVIQYIAVRNDTRDIDYIYDVSLGVWDIGPPKAKEGDSIFVWVYIINNGDVSDTIYAEFVSADVTPIPPWEELIHGETLDIGIAKWFFPWSFIIPATDVNITINAGHWKEEIGWVWDTSSVWELLFPFMNIQAQPYKQ